MLPRGGRSRKRDAGRGAEVKPRCEDARRASRDRGHESVMQSWRSSVFSARVSRHRPHPGDGTPCYHVTCRLREPISRHGPFALKRDRAVWDPKRPLAHLYHRSTELWMREASRGNRPARADSTRTVGWGTHHFPTLRAPARSRLRSPVPRTREMCGASRLSSELRAS